MKKRIISVYLIIVATLFIISVLYFITTYLNKRSFIEARANLASTDLSSFSLKGLKPGESLGESIPNNVHVVCEDGKTYYSSANKIEEFGQSKTQIEAIYLYYPFSHKEVFGEYKGKQLSTEEELMSALGDTYLECKNANTNAQPSIIYHDQVNQMELKVSAYHITFSKTDQPLAMLEPEYEISSIITHAPYATWLAILEIDDNFGRGHSFSILDHITLPLFFALLPFPALACFVYRKKKVTIAVIIGYVVFGFAQFISLIWFISYL